MRKDRSVYLSWVNPTLSWFLRKGWEGSLATEPSYSSRGFGIQGSIHFSVAHQLSTVPRFLQAAGTQCGRALWLQKQQRPTSTFPS